MKLSRRHVTEQLKRVCHRAKPNTHLWICRLSYNLITSEVAADRNLTTMVAKIAFWLWFRLLRSSLRG